jgi:hypothetical protein
VILAAGCLKVKDDGVTLAVRVQPGARKSEVSGMVGNELKVKIASPPVDGAANEALIKFVAELFAVRSSRVALIQGERSRSKVLKIEGIDFESAQAVLASYPL